MNIKKLHSSSIGTHHPEQSIILTEKGEIYVTKNEVEEDGYELVKFQTYDLNQLTTIINDLLKGIAINGKASVKMEAGKIYVSPVVRLYQIEGYQVGESLNEILGGYDGQVISIVGSGVELTIEANTKLRLNGAFILKNEYSILMLQKAAGYWVELSRKENG